MAKNTWVSWIRIWMQIRIRNTSIFGIRIQIQEGKMMTDKVATN